MPTVLAASLHVLASSMVVAGEHLTSGGACWFCALTTTFAYIKGISTLTFTTTAGIAVAFRWRESAPFDRVFSGCAGRVCSVSGLSAGGGGLIGAGVAAILAAPARAGCGVIRDT